jgi:hypothetical protein
MSKNDYKSERLKKNAEFVSVISNIQKDLYEWKPKSTKNKTVSNNRNNETPLLPLPLNSPIITKKVGIGGRVNSSTSLKPLLNNNSKPSSPLNSPPSLYNNNNNFNSIPNSPSLIKRSNSLKELTSINSVKNCRIKSQLDKNDSIDDPTEIDHQNEKYYLKSDLSGRITERNSEPAQSLSSSASNYINELEEKLKKNDPLDTTELDLSQFNLEFIVDVQKVIN